MLSDIVSYMGERKSSKDTAGHAYKLIRFALEKEDLRDEVYCQLLKQTTNNPQKECQMKGWQLLALCTGYFPPSKEFAQYLHVHLHSIQKNKGEPLLASWGMCSRPLCFVACLVCVG